MGKYLFNPKIKLVLWFVFAAGLGLTGLWLMHPARPVTATEPTPTPPSISTPRPGTDFLCELLSGANCAIMNALDVAISSARTWTNPAMGAQNVPTHTLVALTFEQDMDPRTLTPKTFYLLQGATRLAGRLQYIATGKMAIFHPDMPLRPGTTYTATVTTGLRDTSGHPLPADKVWSFTTAPAADGLGAAGASLPGSGMNIYFGDLHGHTGYSDGWGVPNDAFTMARASGLDFYGLTEHAFMMDAAEWQDILHQANLATVNGQFVALPGFEYTNPRGHINVFGSDTYITATDPNYDTFAEFYDWLVAHPTAIGQFNHPSDWENTNFNDFQFYPAADQKMVLQELRTADQFFLSLNSGWHLGTLKNRDTHIANWGCCPLMGLVATALTPEAILEALANRRTFFVSPDDSNLAVTMRANGAWMGSAIPNSGSINFNITVYDPNPTGKPLRMLLYDNGIPIASTTIPNSVWSTWSPSVAAKQNHYYYAGVYQDGWHYLAYSSPIWVEKPPVARAGEPQFAAPGTTVVLDGSQSADPDGDALAYKWTQTGGAAVNLSGGNSARSAFTAPATLGNLDFKLTVVDTGGMSHADTTRVTITNKPILSISKSGPAAANPGEPITYTLTVTNTGLTDAVGLVITDVVPAGATYISGGTLLPGSVVSWNVPALPANGGTVQVSFVVETTGGIVNRHYGASCADCISATGKLAIITNPTIIYLPTIQKNK